MTENRGLAIFGGKKPRLARAGKKPGKEAGSAVGSR